MALFGDVLNADKNDVGSYQLLKMTAILSSV